MNDPICPYCGCTELVEPECEYFDCGTLIEDPEEIGHACAETSLHKARERIAFLEAAKESELENLLQWLEDRGEMNLRHSILAARKEMLKQK